MSIYVLKQKSKEKIFYHNNLNFTPNDLFLIYSCDIPKLTGLYRIRKIHKRKRTRGCSFYKIKNYRRGLDSNDLLYNKIKFSFNASSFTKINRSKFNKIIEQLELKNFQQTVTDYLFFQIKNNLIEIDYIQNHPRIIHIKKYLDYDIKNLKTLIKLLEELIRQIINFYNIDNEFFKLKQRLRNTFFKEFKIINQMTDRFISIKTDEKLSKIPFEIFLFDNKKKFYISRIINVDDIELKNESSFSNSMKFIYPEYKKEYIASQNEMKMIHRKLKNHNYQIYKKSFKPAEFIKILEDSYIVHFSGHSVYNKRRKEYGLKINDRDIFYFSDFSQCLNLPNMITFNSCFKFRHIEHLQSCLKTLFQTGCKNVILPFTEIWEKQPVFFPDFYKYLQDGLEVGKAFRYVMNSFEDSLKFYPMFFRLYGNPMEKYFEKNR